MRSKRFRFHPEATQDLGDAIGWHRSRSPDVAAEFRATLSEVIRHIVKAPSRWPEYLHGTQFSRGEVFTVAFFNSCCCEIKQCVRFA
jgi:plasmid stabilization system protein ParE